MSPLRRLRPVFLWLAKATTFIVSLILAVGLIGLAVVETGWAKNLLRGLIVRQANEYLTATLSIGRLEGSLFRGLQLGDISLGRDGHTLIRIDEVALTYSIRELIQQGVVIRSVRLTRPYVVGARSADGGWDLAALVKRDSREDNRTGPTRPISIQSIEVIDGRISLQDPLDFGAVHAPTDFQALNASFSFAYVPVRWRLNFARLAFAGHKPDLVVSPLTGTLGRGPTGWFFERFAVNTPRSAFTLDGGVNNAATPTLIDLHVRASRFAFQEWAGVIRGLRNIAVDASFETSLKGPVNTLATDLRLSSTGGGVQGQLTLDTTVPGWHGAGAVDVERLNLSRWLNRDDRPSDISGHVTFDLALELGRRFPQGMYHFQGPHAMYMQYVADNVTASGQLTATHVRVAQASATAYGASVIADEGTIGIDAPFPFHFRGTTTGIDLRRVPQTVPVPRVESLLSFGYDITGRFAQPVIAGHATFARSTFLGAVIADGASGSIDTRPRPLTFSGDGEINDVNLRRFGEALNVGWMQQPRYAGAVSGRFHVDGSGTTAATLALTGGGRVSRADIFGGALSDADVSIAIADGTLRASYDGQLLAIDPAVAFLDQRLDASLTGSGKVTATIAGLLLRPPTLGDYDIGGTLDLDHTRVRDLQIDAATVRATLHDSVASIGSLTLRGPALEGSASGRVAIAENTTSDFAYDVTRAELGELRAWIGLDASGTIATKGRLAGPWDSLRATGDATVTTVKGLDVSAAAVSGHYDLTIPSGDGVRASGRATARADSVTLLGQSLQEVSGTVTYDKQQIGFDIGLTQRPGRDGRIAGAAALRPDLQGALLQDLTVTLGHAPWRLGTSATPATISWNDQGVATTPLEFLGANNTERVGIAGTWRPDGNGALHVTAAGVFLDSLQAAFNRPTRYGGVVGLDATLRGTRQKPEVAGTLTIANGRVERISYQQLTAAFTYTEGMFDVDARLDQAPGVWVTAKGKAPLSLLDANVPEKPIDVAIRSSTISLGLLEGITDVVRDVSGEVTIDIRAVGTSRDPHMDGIISLSKAAFLVAATGSHYKNTRGSFLLARDRITVESLHVEDADGNPLDAHGSLGTHELQVGDLEIDGAARHFEVMHSDLGAIDVDAAVRLRGRFEAPRIAGDITISSGTLRVDEILTRTLFQPYSTAPAGLTDLDAVAALNPWSRLGLDVALHVPGSLRLIGDNVQISQDTPIGLGDINLRVAGDLYLYKDPAQPLSVTGSFDQVSGTYAFQGRSFNVFESSSINFRGDLNPDIFVTVTRVISGVEARVSIFGPLRQPELRLASTPPLDPSDILSLIVFNTSTNQLSAGQQQQLVTRAGVLAAGFLAQPIVSAIANETGISILQIEPGDVGSDIKITVGREIAPGLVARFSRNFGQEPYDEATIEIYLSRLFRLRATYSDAQALSVNAFRRVERLGIDLLLFFSF